MPESIPNLTAIVPPDLAGQRFDQIAAELFPEYSRARLQGWIKSGDLTVDAAIARPKDKLAEGSQLALHAVLEPANPEWLPEAIALDIVFEDADILVLNKPAGLVVHPAAGHQDGTLLNALLHHCPDLAVVPRAGIVHRLDKDTTGLMVVAKTVQAQVKLVEQLQARSVHREYDAVICGVPVSGGTVDAPIGRHPRDRQRQAVLLRNDGLHGGGKEAVTHYRVLQRFRAHAHVSCLLETGRTHQIRVHMAHIRHPLVGDPIYGGRFKSPPDASAELSATLREFARQALHAKRLELQHPHTDELMQWRVPMPDDMRNLLLLLQSDSEEHR
ncbi:MAG: 23S rRNA pseudouridine(1911/1915/1917) synthase RluD [Spongiibacteraceae bacterium]